MNTNERLWQKGNFVLNPKAPEWGVGILVETQRGDCAKVFFEQTCDVKQLKLQYVQLEPVEDPGSARSFLENALVDDEAQSKGDRQPFPMVPKCYLFTRLWDSMTSN